MNSRMNLYGPISLVIILTWDTTIFFYIRLGIVEDEFLRKEIKGVGLYYL